MNALLLPGPFGLSHTTRLWQIGRKMIACGWKVAACINPDQEILDWSEFTIYHCPAFPRLTDGNTNIYELGDENVIRSYVVAELEAINSFSADIVLADLRPTARISTLIANKKLTTIANAALTREFNPYAHFDLARAKKLNDKFRTKATQDLVQLYTAVAEKYELNDLNDLFDFIQGDKHLICDLEELFTLSDVNSNVQFIPALFLERDDLIRKDRSDPIINPEKIVIYMTIGNTGDVRLVDLFLAAFEEDQYCQVIISTGLYNEDYQEGYRNPHIFMSPFVDPYSVLPYADIMIHHGGSGSMYQALKYNIPSIVLPMNIEQKLNAMSIEKSQTGVVMDVENITPERLAEKAKKVYQSQKILKENGLDISEKISADYDWCKLFEEL